MVTAAAATKPAIKRIMPSARGYQYDNNRNTRQYEYPCDPLPAGTPDDDAVSKHTLGIRATDAAARHMSASFRLFAVSAIVGVSADELKVTQYAGPTVCEDVERVKKGDMVRLAHVPWAL